MGKTPIGPSPESEVGITIPKSRCPPPRPNPHPDDNKWFPFMVPTIITINIVVFIVVMYINNCPVNSNEGCIGESFLGRFSFQSTRENPLFGPSAATLLEIGALEVKRVVEEHQLWRLLSCMWLHAGAFHVLANMLSLLFVGIGLEKEFGFLRIGLLYVISGLGGSCLSSLFIRNTISVGASGALFGLLGSLLSELFINWSIYENKLESVVSLTIIILINMAVGILPHVDNFAHLGGFITGFLLGFVLLIRPQYGYVSKKKTQHLAAPLSKPKYKPYQCVMLILAVIFLALGFTVSLVMLIRGVDGNDHCPWCHYLTCVPTPLWTCESRCSSSQYSNELNLTCMQNNKTRFYTLNGGIKDSQLQGLCAELCS